jgi:hypothetical protein
LLDEPSVALGYRREHHESHRLALTLSDKDTSIFQLTERLGLDHEMERRQVPRLEPLRENPTQSSVVLRFHRRPFRDAHAFIPRPIQLRAQ